MKTFELVLQVPTNMSYEDLINASYPSTELTLRGPDRILIDGVRLCTYCV